MESLIKKYSHKLVAQNLCDADTPLLGAIDDTTIWNRESDLIPALEDVIASLNINSILFAPVKEPYKSIISYLADNSSSHNNTIYPDDTETRTFLHDIPVTSDFNPDTISKALKKRKGIIVKDRGIISWGTLFCHRPTRVFANSCLSLQIHLYSPRSFVTL